MAPHIDQALPQTHGLPFLGVLPALIKHPFDFFLDARERYGDIYILNLGLSQLVVLNHPRHAHHVLLDNDHNYRKGGALWDSLRTLLGNGLPVSEGAFWMRQRRMMQPHFHRNRLAHLADVMVATIGNELETWDIAADIEKEVDLLPLFNQITMKVIVRTLFGGELARTEVDTVATAMTLILDYTLRGMIMNVLPRWTPLPGASRYRQALQQIDTVVFDVIQRCRARADETLISLLLHMVDADTGEQMTEQQLRDEAVTLFLAGYETTSLALAWAYHLLMQHPDTLLKLQTEIDSVLGNRIPTAADLPQLSYTRWVVQEALRLRPPGWWLPRTAIATDTIDGFVIPAGTNVVLLTYVIQHHPDYWKHPAQFDPERFRSGPQHPCAWMPFGVGQRQCMGKEFALMEAQLILAMMTQRYHIRAVPGRTAQLQLASTLKPKGGVFAHLTNRSVSIS